MKPLRQWELARKLNVSTRTILTWSQRPGAPKPRADGKFRLAEWQRFRDAQLLKGSVQSEEHIDRIYRRRELQLRAMELDIRRAELALAREQADLLPVAPILALLDWLSNRMGELDEKYRTNGDVDAAECFEDLRKRFDDVVSRIRPPSSLEEIDVQSDP